MKVTFEPKLGLEVLITEDGDFCLAQTNNSVFISIGQMRSILNKMPELMKAAEEQRAKHLSEVQ